MAKGIQKRFIESVQENLDMSIDDIAKKIGVHRRTLADWRREKYLISLPSLNKLSKISGRPVPKEVEIKHEKQRQPELAIQVRLQEVSFTIS